MSMSHPPLDTVARVVATLEAAGIEVALGGSGLLLAYGLVDQVRDWDLTTEAEPDAVEAALTGAGVPFTSSLGDTERYATARRVMIEGGDHDVDLMVRFAIRTAGGVVTIPTMRGGSWRGLPLGSLVAWLVAYRLMRRPAKPDVLARYVGKTGADAAHVTRMLAEPLPPEVRAELAGLLRISEDS